MIILRTRRHQVHFLMTQSGRIAVMMIDNIVGLLHDRNVNLKRAEQLIREYMNKGYYLTQIM